MVERCTVYLDFRGGGCGGKARHPPPPPTAGCKVKVQGQNSDAEIQYVLRTFPPSPPLTQLGLASYSRCHTRYYYITLVCQGFLTVKFYHYTFYRHVRGQFLNNVESSVIVYLFM